MNRLRKVVGNTVISLIGQGVTWTSTLVLTIAYGRFLGDVKFGELYFAITFVALIGFPTEFGFNQQLTRDVAQEPSRALRYLSNILCLKFLLWTILYGAILLLCWRLGYPAEVRTLVVICGITLLTGSLANTMSAMHYSFERVIYPVIGTVLEKGLSAFIGVIVLRFGANVEVMALVLLVSSCISLLWQTFWALKVIGLPVAFDIPLARQILLKSIPFLVYGALGVIYYRIDTVLLSLFTNAAVVGWYGAGYRIFDTLVFLPSLVISAIMYPVFSKLSVHSETDLRLAVEKSLNFLLFCGMPIATGLIVAAPPLVGFLYHHKEFVHAIPVMQYLAPGLLFLYVNSVLTAVMISTGREKNITIMAAIALVFNLTLNLLLIPRFQQVGAAAVTSLTELMLMTLATFLIPHSLRPFRSLKVGMKALLAAIIMGIAIWFLRQVNFLLILPVAAVVYFVVTTLLGTIPRDDLKALYNSIRHKAARTAPAPIQEEAIHEVVPFFSEEEMQPELESIVLMSQELIDPLMPVRTPMPPLPETPSPATIPVSPLPLAVEPYDGNELDEASEITVPRIEAIHKQGSSTSPSTITHVPITHIDKNERIEKREKTLHVMADAQQTFDHS